MTKGASPANKDKSKISCQLAKIMCPHLQWLTIDTGSRPSVVYGLPFLSLNVKDPKKFVFHSADNVLAQAGWSWFRPWYVQSRDTTPVTDISIQTNDTTHNKP